MKCVWQTGPLCNAMVPLLASSRSGFFLRLRDQRDGTQGGADRAAPSLFWFGGRFGRTGKQLVSGPSTYTSLKPRGGNVDYQGCFKRGAFSEFWFGGRFGRTGRVHPRPTALVGRPRVRVQEELGQWRAGLSAAAASLQLSKKTRSGLSTSRSGRCCGMGAMVKRYYLLTSKQSTSSCHVSTVGAAWGAVSRPGNL